MTHEPTRPSWHCRTCGVEWPCPIRRRELLAESAGSRVYVALRMAPYLSEALDDRPDLDPTVLHARFLGWVRRLRP